MKCIAFEFVLIAIIAAVSAQQLTVNTPSAVTACLPSQISWSGGTGPYFMSVIPGGQVNGTPLKEFPQTTANSITWQQVDIPAGTSVTIQIRDSTGTINYSDKFTIQPSTVKCSAGASNSTSTPSTSSSTPSTSAPPAANTSAPTTSNNTSTSTSSSAPKANSSAPTSTTGTTSSSTTPASTTPNSASTTSTGAQAGATSGAVQQIPSFAALGLAAALCLFA